MNPFPLGQPITLSTTVTDVETGLPADAGAITLTLYKDGVLVQTYTPAHDGDGLYHQDVPVTDLATAGQYRFFWTSTGANAGEKMDVFDVFDPADYPRLVSFDDAKTVVKALGDQDDPLLDRMIGWASARILMEVQAYKQSFTQVVNVRGGDCFFKLSHTPVASITSITALNPYSWSPPDVSTLVATIPNVGHVEATIGGLAGTYTVTYVAGTDTVPPGVDGACLALLQHWWGQIVSRRSQSYGQGPAGAMPDFRGLPNTVRNLLDTVSAPWGMA
jgi:hypothetical protein